MKQYMLFIGLPVVLTTMGEFILKSTINSIDVSGWMTQFSVGMSTPFELLNQIVDAIAGFTLLFFLNPLLLLALGCIFVGGLFWLVAMSKFELSFLYPFLSINYVSIVIGSQLFLGESVSLYRYISVVFIIIGLIILSRSPHSERQKEVT